MTEDESRRYTDEEVAVVLKKAAELDEVRGTQAGSGLTRRELEDIAREVGISGTALNDAMASLDRGGAGHRSILGAPLTRSAVHAVDGRLTDGALANLVRVVDERADSTGTVSEALGSVRWTASDRFKSTQVTITPQEGETSIRVVEKATARLRRVVTLIPGAWGAMIAGAAVGGADAGAAAGLTMLGVGVAAGIAAGRGVWSLLSRSSAARVEKLAADLAREARGAERTDPQGPDEPPGT